MSLTQPTLGRSGLPRWLIERIWGLEHAFERARASGKAEDDTRLRIFFVLALFSLFFVTLAVGATRAALFSDAARNVGIAAPAFTASIKHQHYPPPAPWHPDTGQGAVGTPVTECELTHARRGASMPNAAP